MLPLAQGEERPAGPRQAASRPLDAAGPRRTSTAAALVVFVSVAAMSVQLAHQRPLTSHEILVARSATEMEARGDWLVPFFNGEPRLQKPPLNAWLAALAHEAVGTAGGPVTELESRLPSFLCAIGVALVAFLIGREIGGQRVAILAGVLTGSSFGVYRFGTSARPEMTYALFTALAVLALVRLRKGLEGAGPRTGDAVLLWGAVLGAILAKGPFLPAFVLAAALIVLLLERRGRSLARMLKPWFALPALLLAAAWFVAAAWRTPGAVDFWRHQMFDRVGDDEGGSLLKNVAALYYVYATPLLTVPWAALLPLALCYRLFRALPRTPEVSFLWWSIVTPAAILSLSAGRHDFYMLPIVPSMTALMAWTFVRLLDSQAASPRVRRALGIGVLVHAVLIAAACAAAGAIPLTSWKPFGLAHDPITAAGIALAAAGAALAVLAAFLAVARPWAAAVLLTFAVAAGIGAAADAEIGGSPDRESAKAFALAVKERVPPGAPIVALLPADAAPVIYYADRIVPELNLEQFGERAAKDPALFAVLRRKALRDGVVSGEVLASEVSDDDPRVLVTGVRVAARPR